MSQLCYYGTNTIGALEKGPRLKPFDLSTTACGDKIQHVGLFIQELNNEIDLLGCISVTDLLNVRANGESVDAVNLCTRMICKKHFESLVTNWEKSEQKTKNNRQSRSSQNSQVKCPLDHKKKSSVVAEDHRRVNKEMCIHWLEKEGVLIPPGTKICRYHQGQMRKKDSQSRRDDDPEFDPVTEAVLKSLEDVEESEDEDCTATHKSPPPTTKRVERTLSREIVDAVSALVKALGGDRVLTRGEWDKLADSTKRKKVNLVSRIFRTVCEAMTPDGKDELYARATAHARVKDNSELADRIFDSIDERFSAAPNAQEKVQLLSLVIRCVPSATLHYLNLAKNFNRGGVDFEKKFRRESYDEKKSDRYVEFLSRANVLVILPWGDTLTTLSDGTKTPIASVARKFSFSRIYRMYLRDLEATNEMHLKLGRGSTTRILKVVARRKNERMVCVDEFAVDSYEGWKQLTSVVEELRGSHGLIGVEDERALKRWIRISKSHLEGEYLSEVCESSNVPQHCSRYALSDPSRKCFCMDCDHVHDGVCQDCDQMDLLLSHLKSLTQKLAEDASSSDSANAHRISRLHEIVQFSCEKIRCYQAHVLRTAVSNSGRADIVDNLENGEALLTLDFGMKIIPEKAIEGQSDFFGKRGICLHIGHALAKIDGKVVDHTFAHTLDDVTQDSGLVFSIVRHILGILEAKGIHKVYLRSDNAGAYKNCALISALFHLSSPKMQIVGYYFSESQSGKGSCDRACAHCKRKMREWTSSENNICCARNIFEALTVKDEVVRGLSTYYCSYSSATNKITNVFPGITHFYSFGFEEEGVRAHCQNRIGEGKMTKNEKLPTIDCSLVVEEEGGHTGDSFWSNLNSSESENSAEEKEEDEEHDRDDMFHCSTIGCLRSFRSTRWLIEHEIKGNHEFTVKKKTMTDKAVTKFNELIETRESARIAVSEQVETVGDHGDRNDHEQGWALKSSHTTHKLDNEAKRLATEYFKSQRELKPPRRADGGFMRRKLADELDPSDPTGTRYLLEYSKVPSEKQLMSLFSRLERSRRNATPKPQAHAVKVLKTARGTPNTSTKSTRSKSSVRTPKGGTRKRTVMVESEESELEEDKEEEETDEILEQDEADFMKQVIEEEIDEIYL